MGDDYDDGTFGEHSRGRWDAHHWGAAKSEVTGAHRAERNLPLRVGMMLVLADTGPTSDWLGAIELTQRLHRNVTHTDFGSVRNKAMGQNYVHGIRDAIVNPHSKIPVWGWLPTLFGLEWCRLTHDEHLNANKVDLMLDKRWTEEFFANSQVCTIRHCCTLAIPGTYYCMLHGPDDGPPDPPGGTQVPSRPVGGPSGPPRIVPEKKSYPDKEITL